MSTKTVSEIPKGSVERRVSAGSPEAVSASIAALRALGRWPGRNLLGLGIRRIAVFRALQLGDLLCAVPAFRALRGAFPSAEISLIGLPWAAEFARRFASYIDEAIEFPGFPGLPERPADLRRFPRFLSEVQGRRFDLLIQMHGSGTLVNSLSVLMGARYNAGFFPEGGYRPDPDFFMPFRGEQPEILQHLSLMEFLGVPSQGNDLEFPITPEDRRAFTAHPRLQALRPGAYVCVHPGAQLPSRRWPPERFAQVADALSHAGLEVVLTGTAEERPLTEAMARSMTAPAANLAGETSLGTLAVLLEGARMLLSNDTGLSHMAAALRTPSVIVASGSDVRRWAPLDRRRHRVLFHQVDCRPCAHAECPVGHVCALGVSAASVAGECLSLLKDAAVHAAA